MVMGLEHPSSSLASMVQGKTNAQAMHCGERTERQDKAQRSSYKQHADV